MAKVKKTKFAQDILFEDLFPVRDAMLVLISSPIELSKYNCFHSSEATVATVKIIQLSFNPATVLAWENLAVTTALIKSSTRLEKWKITYVYVLTYSLLLKSFVFPLNPSSSMSYQNWIKIVVRVTNIKNWWSIEPNFIPFELSYTKSETITSDFLVPCKSPPTDPMLSVLSRYPIHHRGLWYSDYRSLLIWFWFTTSEKS